MREGWEGGEKLECKRESGRQREKEEAGREEGERINWVSVAELENFASVM